MRTLCGNLAGVGAVSARPRPESSEAEAAQTARSEPVRKEKWAYQPQTSFRKIVGSGYALTRTSCRPPFQSIPGRGVHCVALPLIFLATFVAAQRKPIFKIDGVSPHAGGAAELLEAFAPGKWTLANKSNAAKPGFDWPPTATMVTRGHFYPPGVTLALFGCGAATGGRAAGSSSGQLRDAFGNLRGFAVLFAGRRHCPCNGHRSDISGDSGGRSSIFVPVDLFRHRAVDVFRPIPYPDHRKPCYADRPFLIIAGSGVVIERSARPAEIAMLGWRK